MTEKQRHTILVVDDDEQLLLMLSRALSKEYDVITARNGSEALDILTTKAVDVIVSDQNMPGITGVEFFQRVAMQYPFVGRILLTGVDDLKAAMDAAINQGAVDKFMNKPCDPQKLNTYIQEVLRSRAIIAATTRKEIETQLIHCDKMASLGGLLAGIAHEINNPLSFVTSNLTNLARFVTEIFDLLECYEQLDLPAEQRDVLEQKRKEIDFPYLRTRIPNMIERSLLGAERMRKIILELKIFSRAAGDEIEKADIHAALDSVLDILYNEYKNRIEVKKAYGDLPLVACNISKVVQVFMNILMNACHAIPDKGEIRVKTEARDGLVYIAIQDTGTGISAEVLQHIFEPFFTTKAAGKGTGLGLSISHAIIQQHGGHISVATKTGEGTCFTITLPVEASETS